MTQFFIHIGMHKTATTFLQREVFPRLSGVHFVPPTVPLNHLLRRAPGTKVLISDENLSGRPWRMPPDAAYSWREDRETSLTNAAALFPGAKPLACFRKHRDFVVSLYKQYLHQGGTSSLEHFFRLDGSGIVKPADLDYRRVIGLLADRFDDEAFVFTYDQYASFDRLLPRICSALETPIPSGIDPNKRFNRGVRGIQATILRRLNQASASAMNPNGRLPLNSRPLRLLGLQPRSFCQRWLAGVPSADVAFRPAVAAEIDRFFSDDWSFVLERRIDTERDAGPGR